MSGKMYNLLRLATLSLHSQLEKYSVPTWHSENTPVTTWFHQLKIKIPNETTGILIWFSSC
ncbi:hypothetical protein HU200_053428 [Digitaria exilis]|uniref:Uncharacterized protein n=1 Tax=Digitaria exilis TaxID=1010633 RepID=A0A835AMH7_9POAL|nr:hypothetical protein HU200_053428 [Digitaria exilis]